MSRSDTPVPVDLTLRSSHADFLRQTADPVRPNLSQTFAKLLAVARGRPEFQQARPTLIKRLHLNMDAEDLDFLYDLGRLWGVSRSVAAQRLIDMAQEGRLSLDEAA